MNRQIGVENSIIQIWGHPRLSYLSVLKGSRDLLFRMLGSPPYLRNGWS